MGAGAGNRRPGAERDKEGQRGLLSLYNGMSRLPIIIIHTRKIYIYIYRKYIYVYVSNGPPWRLSGKEFACNAADAVLIPRSQRSPGEGNGNPLQYSCL